jgi:hypothetical protein
VEILLLFVRGGIIKYYASHRVLSEDFVLRNEDILHFNQQFYYFMKEDSYVWKIDLFGIFCFSVWLGWKCECFTGH